MGPHCFPEKPRAQINFSALIRAFQHLTVAIEHVLSTALRPPRLAPQTEVLASREVQRGLWHQSLTQQMLPPSMPAQLWCYRLDINPWVLASQDLLCSALWFNNTSPLGDQGRVLGKPHSQWLRFQPDFSATHSGTEDIQVFQQCEWQPQPPQGRQQGLLWQLSPRKLNGSLREIKYIRGSSLNTNLLSWYPGFWNVLNKQ